MWVLPKGNSSMSGASRVNEAAYAMILAALAAANSGRPYEVLDRNAGVAVKLAGPKKGPGPVIKVGMCKSTYPELQALLEQLGAENVNIVEVDWIAALPLRKG